eukprot:gb/GFBE01019902.1/.p1 GENE.gb/GFBE01019902.1/~~gb/GFBE01019902.1/.p1  ORF type:complete len:295 (+),score=76.37 gb/GFBE01019902.1/:1-885(+)
MSRSLNPCLLPTSLRGMRGLNVRNTFLEFKEEDDQLGDLDFARQASEPAKPSSWNRQLSEQTTAGTMDIMDGAEDSAGELDDALLNHASNFAGSSYKSGAVLAHAANFASSEASLLSALQAMTTSSLKTASAPPIMPDALPTMVPRFCPNCGAKVVNQTHRFCAYCCYSLVQLQHEAAAAQVASMLPPPLPGVSGATNPLLSNIQQQAAALFASTQGFPQGLPTGPGKGLKAPPTSAAPPSEGEGYFLNSIRHFRYMEADTLDVELAKALCLTHLHEELAREVVRESAAAKTVY